MVEKKFCVVIPAYNEASVIKGVVRSARKVFSSFKYPVDIVVIDDGSRDNTSTEAMAGGARVIRHILNSGAGGATATGLSYAMQYGYTGAATMDADGQHDPQDVLRGITEISTGNIDL